eukprot:TRINITY_DN65743_c0_g1_i1.p1 TRINITY_DN65743_c0_g1~~TRINITY_DN65743_c0_g1_i1.p1  ORF type:complete len:481 (-),score=38.99 TRINITY_DN65743_c0_g1_i1:207-1649(-)
MAMVSTNDIGAEQCVDGDEAGAAQADEEYGAFHRRLFVLCGVIWAVGGGGWFTCMQYMLNAVAGRWDLPREASGVYASVFFIGMMVGAPLLGTMSDRWGRRPALLLAMLSSSVAGTACVFAMCAEWLAAFQFLHGVGVGGLLPLAPMLFCEWCPTYCRGRKMSLLSISFPISTILYSGVAWLCQRQAKDVAPWQLLYALGAGLEFLVFLASCVALPESPRYLAVLQGRQRDSQSARHVVYDQGGGSRPSRPSWQGLRCSWAVLLGPELRSTTLLLWIVWFGVSFGAGGFHLFLPGLLASKHIVEGHIYRDIFLFNVAGMFGVLLGALAVEDRLGRIYSIVLSVAATAALIALFAFTATEWELVVLSCLFNVSTNIAWPVLYAYTPEVYATEVRAQGVASSAMLHSTASALSPLLASLFVDGSSRGLWKPRPDVALFAFAGLLGLSALAAARLPLETRGRELRDRVGERPALPAGNEKIDC